MTNPSNHTTAKTDNDNTGAKPMFVYFVAIQYFPGGGAIGFTHMEIPVTVQLTSLARIQEIEQYLRTQGYPQALIVGFTLLRTETASTPGRS